VNLDTTPADAPTRPRRGRVIALCGAVVALLFGTWALTSCSSYKVTGYDTMALPGSPVQIRAKVERSGILLINPDVRGSEVSFYRTDGEKTVYEEISGGQDTFDFGARQVNARAYCAGFNFRGADQQKSVAVLSGGERNRLHLAKLLKSGGNLLLLDEPTNDLDVDTLRALEEALLGFAGCAVVISHDRWFLDRIATHILAFEGDSEVLWFEGNYQDYVADLKRRKGMSADQPHRIRYKKLVR
jgi:energy-coupling factor transporter ATP-binding protein EcfA2